MASRMTPWCSVSASAASSLARAPGDDVALRQSPAAERGGDLVDAALVEQRPVEFLTDEHVAQLGHHGR